MYAYSYHLQSIHVQAFYSMLSFVTMICSPRETIKRPITPDPRSRLGFSAVPVLGVVLCTVVFTVNTVQKSHVLG